MSFRQRASEAKKKVVLSDVLRALTNEKEVRLFGKLSKQFLKNVSYYREEIRSSKRECIR